MIMLCLYIRDANSLATGNGHQRTALRQDWPAERQGRRLGRCSGPGLQNCQIDCNVSACGRLGRQRLNCFVLYDLCRQICIQDLKVIGSVRIHSTAKLLLFLVFHLPW